MRAIFFRRVIRDAGNPLEILSDNELIQRYRFSRNSIQNVLLPLVYPRNNPRTRRGLPIPAVIKLCTALRFYASGSHQRVCGDVLEISQSSCCRIVNEVSEILSRNIGRFIKFADAIFSSRIKFFEMLVSLG